MIAQKLERRSSLAEIARDARVLMIGDGSHGTSEFYRERARLTKTFVESLGARAVAIEADWPDAARVDAYVRSEGGDATAEEALRGFDRFPRWMWRNEETAEFVEWLREYNRAQPERACGIYGMDLYSLHASMRAVISYLERCDPDAARRARERYACFDRYGIEPQDYGYLAIMERDGCRDVVLAQFEEMQRLALSAAKDGALDANAFAAAQNARLVADSERYYRAMYEGGSSSWNVRDRHMAETVEALESFLRRAGAEPRLVLWAHNSHLGDSRATQMAEYGETNVGSLVRLRLGREAFGIGMTTYDGTVMAADDWGGPHSEHLVQPALPESYEAYFHQASPGEQFVLLLRDASDELTGELHPRLERAIGVIYRPRTERASHYFRARIASQFDAVIHIDRTHAVVPLDPLERSEPRELPETYPSGE